MIAIISIEFLQYMVVCSDYGTIVTLGYLLLQQPSVETPKHMSTHKVTHIQRERTALQ